MSRNRGAGLKTLDKRCLGLRWKGMFIDADDDPTVQLSNSRIYWCVFSQNPVGPDGGALDVDRPTAPRTCYKRV